ncbi:SDR family NAD(P)-dependent oxidoreductase [Brachybacterium sp. DNPG3]
MTGGTILLTGATGGVGSALALRLAARGERLLLSARDRPRLEALATQVEARGGTAEIHPCDLRDQDAVAALARRALAAEAPPSALISCAGHSIRRPLADSLDRPHDLVRLAGTNTLGPAALILAMLGPLREAGGGRIVAVTSATARIPAPGFAAYGASKAGLDAWLRAVRPEAERWGVGIAIVELPLVATAMAEPTYGAAPRGALSPERAAERVLRALDGRATLLSPWWARAGATLSQALPASSARAAGIAGRLAQGIMLRERRGADGTRGVPGPREGDRP